MKKISPERLFKIIKYLRKSELRKRKRNLKKRKHSKTKRYSTNRNNIVILPKRMDFESDPKKVIEVLKTIRRALRGKNSFLIDHSQLSYISMEALVLLTAEIESDFYRKMKQSTYSGSGKLRAVNKYLPKNEKVNEILHKAGYWRYFSIGKKFNADQGARTYLNLTSDDSICGQKIGELIEFFEKKVFFKPTAKDRFSDAMLEAAANTVEHAYVGKGDAKTLKKWWLTACLDESESDEKEISFVFYDQGVGIIQSLYSQNRPAGSVEIRHSKYKRFIKKYVGLFKLSEPEIVQLLLTSNLSKYKDERRGNGFQSFLKFLRSSNSGSLRIATSNFIYNALEKQAAFFGDELAGTMIVWRMKINKDQLSDIYLR